MLFQLHAACGCHTGRIRSGNEDNFYFNGRHLGQENNGMEGTAAAKYLLTGECCFGVFDGMGGVEFGEVASYTAVKTLKEKMALLNEHLASPRPFLEEAIRDMNLAVCAESQRLASGRMGSTAAMLMFVPDEVYVCGLGDSRVYRLRDSQLMQLSRDDVERFPPDMEVKRKPRLTQYLGVFPEDLILEPYIAKGELQKDDIYLICSDGLTDMLTNLEIYNCLKSHASVRKAAEHLISEALKNGGRDNVTVIVIKVQ